MINYSLFNVMSPRGLSCQAVQCNGIVIAVECGIWYPTDPNPHEAITTTVTCQEHHSVILHWNGGVGVGVCESCQSTEQQRDFNYDHDFNYLKSRVERLEEILYAKIDPPISEVKTFEAGILELAKIIEETK